jgi:hypothetical protein
MATMTTEIVVLLNPVYILAEIVNKQHLIVQPVSMTHTTCKPIPAYNVVSLLYIA